MNLIDRDISQLSGEVCDQQRIARLFCVSPESVRQWQKAGCPHEPAGSVVGDSCRFDSAQVAHWLLTRTAEQAKGGGDTLRQRQLKIKVERDELKLAKEKGEPIPRHDVLATWRGKGKRCTPAELCDIFRIRLETLLDWHGLGLPSERTATGEEWYASRQCIEWACWRERVAPGSTMHKLGEVGPDDDEPAAA